ncbi:MAG: 3-deoxy-manno-octulosonate cytidylyltransferase, partial [Sphingobacteriia bacterium]
MKILGVIPARYNSSRFPGKPLADIGGGKTFLEHVYKRCIECRLITDLVVATDDDRIYNTTIGFGGRAVMTQGEYVNGTERTWAVAQLMPDYDAYINIQCDAFFISAQQLNLLAACISKWRDNVVVTLIKPITDNRDMQTGNTVKVVRQTNGYALYFTRSTVPYNVHIPLPEDWMMHHTYYKHIGVYGFTREALQKAATFPQSPLEIAESLEQLRWMENGMRVYTAITLEDAVSID